MGKKRLVISLLLTIFFVFLLQPFYSTGNLLTSFLATKNHKLYRMDVFASGASTNKVELISHTPNTVFQSPNWFKNPKWRKDKGNGSVIHGALKSKWQDSFIKLKVKGDGKLFISLRGEDKKIDGKRYPVLVDYKKLVVNGKPVLLGRKTIWHDRPFNYSLPVKNGDVVTLEVTVRTHHFRWSDLRYVYDVNFKILFTVFILSFLFSYKFVQYVARFKILEHHSRIDIVFLCVFFALLFVPMLKINPADKSLQENRMLAKYPALFVSNGLNLKFGSLFEKWFNDRFLGREWLIKIHDSLKFYLNKYYANTKVFTGKDGWMFFQGDRKEFLFSEKQKQDIYRGVEALNKFCNQHEIKCYLEVVPAKSSIVPEAVFRKDFFQDAEIIPLLSSLSDKIGIDIIFPLEELKQAHKKDYVYFKTDHHWTEWGAYIGYKAFIEKLKEKYSHAVLTPETDYDIFYSHQVRAEFNRQFWKGYQCQSLNLTDETCRLNVKYKNYKNKDESHVVLHENSKKGTKDFYYPKAKGKVVVIGNSFAENFVSFLPYSFQYTKKLRSNSEGQDNFKLSRWKKDILEFHPDVLVFVFHTSYIYHLKDLKD